KDAEEIAFMKQSQAISEKALDETLQIIRPGMSEKEVASELVYRMLRFGSEGNAFDPIVVTGKNTSLPHGVPGDSILQPGDFLTMDFGSLKGGYCSDMTRTVAVCSSTDEMRNIYSIVLEAQLAGIRAAKSGIPGCEIDAAARRVIQDAGFGSCFGHGFGHSLGLDIHERPNLNPREKTPMPENAVVSAEPGIYLPGRFGVRIEDVMILRSDGSEVITKAPKDTLLTVG
ncbi:MAG: aminopeptidase P family protein, partial [Oscillospiraceae bacterium]|nr:aminopeptidase P family protein [Oscillospiraceae bacterium]